MCEECTSEMHLVLVLVLVLGVRLEIPKGIEGAARCYATRRIPSAKSSWAAAGSTAHSVLTSLSCLNL